MKTKTILITIILSPLSTPYLVAQEDGWTTFYAEKMKFKIDLPDAWNPVFNEVKGALGIYSAAASASLENEEFTRGVVILTGSYKPKMGVKGINAPVEKDLKWHQKQYEKDAKKESDPEYRFLGATVGEEFHIEKLQGGWNDYVHTSVYESGEKNVLRKHDVFVYFMSAPRYRLRVMFFCREGKWDSSKETFDKILGSLDRYDP